jgi:hypothetical protein
VRDLANLTGGASVGGARSTAGVRLTDRDRDLLAFAAEHRLVLEPQLERLVDAGHGKLAKRLGALVGAGYLCRGRAFEQRHYQIRSGGLAAIDSPLPVPRFNPAAYKHDVGLAWLWLAAQRGTFGSLSAVLSERRLRSHDAAFDRAREPYAVRLGGLDRHGNDCLHYPDLLLIDPRGRRLALELELSPKARARRELILGGYGADARFDRVLYLVEHDPRGRAIRRLMGQAVRDMGLAGRVHFQYVKPLLAHEKPSRVPARAVRRGSAEATR